jgi:hypothetical protein
MPFSTTDSGGCVRVWVVVVSGALAVLFGGCSTVTGGSGAGGPGSSAQWIAFDGANMWVTDPIDGQVTELSPSGAVLGTFPVAVSPQGIAFDGASMWVTFAGPPTPPPTPLMPPVPQTFGVTRLSAAGATLGTFSLISEVTSLPGSQNAVETAMAFDGTNMWISNELDGGYVLEMTKAGATLGTFSAGPTRRRSRSTARTCGS